MARKGKNRKSKNPGKEALASQILGIFSGNPRKSYNYKQISKLTDSRDEGQRKLIYQILTELTHTEQLEEVEAGKYRLKARAGYITGRVDIAQQGYGFVISDEVEQDIFIARNLLHSAMDGDLVKVYVYPHRSKETRNEGEVMQIIERARESFVGTVEISKHFAFLVTDNKKMPYDLFIPLDKLKGVKNGQKAIARIVEWPEGGKNPIAEITEVLGNPGENDVEMHAILAEFDLPFRFEKEIVEASEKVDGTITEKDYAERRDFRNIPTFTIDPADAKDFDDALSLRKLENGHWEVGVHIADVSHYVKTGTVLDEEAFQRGTSIYLVDRTIPMLPERISNFLCSLRPDEEKLCFSAVFEINNDAVVLSEWFGRTVIKSQKRFDYEQALEIIKGKDGDMKAEILELHALAQKFRKKRYNSGSLGFDRVEVKFHLDEKGFPTGVFFKEQNEANQLIEEFMLLANKQVAEFVHKGCIHLQNRKKLPGEHRESKEKQESKAKTFVYRIHDNPNPEKLESFATFIRKFGYSVSFGPGKKTATSLNKLLDEVVGKKEQNVIETLALRAMAKARYTTANIGHYGLAFPYYTHFTSPIRRYPDMMVHRLLWHYLKDGESKSKLKYEKRCEHASDMEKKALDAERASIKYKQVEFMKDKVGMVFDAIISGLTSWGIYAEIVENKCEGMIPVQNLMDDFYEFDEDNYILTGRQTKKVFQLGDEIKIVVKNVNMAKRQMDYGLAD
jgi:ribonuclease R